jgi:hypothetical protein
MATTFSGINYTGNINTPTPGIQGNQDPFAANPPTGNFLNRFLQLSRCDGVHDQFKNFEFSHYFPNNTWYAAGDPAANAQVPSIPQMMESCFGPYVAPNLQQLMAGALVDFDGNNPLIPPNHGLNIITNSMGYKYASMQRTSASPATQQDYITDGNHLEQKLQALGIPVGETIYLFVDVVGGLYSILNRKATNNYTFKVVFNRATITDPAPNTIPQIRNTASKPNQFKYVNRSSAPNGNKQVEFAIEDLESPDIVINGYTDYHGLSAAMDFSDKENTLSRTFVSKYKVCLSYCKPGVIKQNGRGPNPKKMKAALLVYDIANNRVRTMDSKACEKKSSAVAVAANQRTWFTRMKNRIKRRFNMWLGDSNGATHSLGKKSGDWLQVVQSMNSQLKIHTLTGMSNPVLGGKQCYYGPKETVAARAVRAVVTHDRNEKTYALLCGAPMVIFKNAGTADLPQFYEIYVKDYLTTITPQIFNTRIQEYISQRDAYNRKIQQFLNHRIPFLTAIDDVVQSCIVELARINSNQQGGITFPDINNLAHLIRQIVYVGILPNTSHSFDQPYKSIISLLNYVKVILTLSEVKDIEMMVPVQNRRLENSAIPQQQQQQGMRVAVDAMLIDIAKYKTELGKLNRNLRIAQENQQMITSINDSIAAGSSILTTADIENNCAIFRYKIAQSGTVVQKQLFIHENICYSFLESIMKTEKELRDGIVWATQLDQVDWVQGWATPQNPPPSIGDSYTTLFQNFQQGRQYLRNHITNCIRYLNSTDIDTYRALVASLDVGGANSQVFMQMSVARGNRRLSPRDYIAYVVFNLKAVKKMIDVEAHNVMHGGVKTKTQVVTRAQMKNRMIGKVVGDVMKKIPGTKAYRVIKQKREKREAEMSKMRSETKMKQVLYNYSTVFENYISFLLIELNNGTRLQDLDYRFSGGSGTTVTNFLRWLSDINNPLNQGGLQSLSTAQLAIDDDASPLTQINQNQATRTPLPGNRDAYLHLLNADIDNNIDNNIELMKIGNKINMIDTLFPLPTYTGPYNPLPNNDLYKTTVNNIDLYIGELAWQTGQSVVVELEQIKQIEFLRYLVYNRIENGNGDYILDNAGNFTYNPPDNGLVDNPRWTNFLVQGGGLTKQKQKGTKRRRNKKKKTRRKKKRRRKKTIKKRRRRGRKTRRK